MAKKAAAEPTVEEAPILPGYEQDESLDTVTLTGGGPADGTWRVVASLPHVVLAGGDRYVLSDRAAKVYALEVR